MSFTRRPSSGHPRQISHQNDHHIIRIARVQPAASSDAILAKVVSSVKAHVSSQTIRRRLAEGHLESRDESTFNLISDDNRVREWKPRGERLNPVFALQRHTAATAGVKVWGAIVYNTQSSPVLIRGTMIAQRYVHDILQPHVLPLMPWIPGAYFKQNNALPWCHKTVSALVLPFIGLPDPQICLQSSIFGIIWEGELGIP
ncbi:transposable element Tcb2 transposase [Trichonephila clavipes]|nr:transposable element Tcb2 transposase [Trichonephila clavipes]